LFKEYQYQNLSLAVCRPGLGTVQRLISRKIPMFVVNEKNNYEINNNCKKLVENKLAIKINLNNVDFFLRKIKNAKNLINLYKSYNKEQTNGAYQAAQWIVNKINEQ
jgi:UDP-N-acetylglucosamine:LPS N-acetylglucosamine transferase